MAFNNDDGTRRGRLFGAATTAAFFLMFFALPVLADYEAGKKAWDAGKKSEALAQWKAAAKKGDPRAALALTRALVKEGDARAMAGLGQLYLDGVGVPQNFVDAHMWFNLAASRGVEEAAKARDAVAAKMTPQQIATAQERARSWRPGMVEGRERSAGSGAAAGSPPPRAIREAQGLLGKLGYEPGPADGVWGGRSAKAYGSFLRDAGMAQSGTLTPEGLRALRAAAGGAGTGAGTGVSADPAPRQPVAPAAPAAPALPRDALHRAVKAGDIDGLKAALKEGAEIDARDGGGWTALMHAAAKGYKVMVGPLLEAGADVNVQAADGATALFMAVAGGHTAIVELLMKAGADITIKGPQERTAVDVARMRYGEASAARDQGADRSLVALLEGQTWAEVEAERRRREERERLAREEKERKERKWREIQRRMAMHFNLPDRGKDCEECPEMVVLPAGEFMMGSPDHEEGRSSDEGPQHRVRIGQPIAVGKYEVTFAEWEACLAGGGCRGYRPGDQGWGRGRRPVINVSWEDAKAYVRWLREKTGEGYRLLGEAEWEYAARAGTRGPFHFGSTISTDQANYDGDYTYGSGVKGVDRVRTVRVGSFPANDFGLYDMHGNVWEWVEDCWHGDYSGAPTDGRAWTTGGNCGPRVLRGGSWLNWPWFLRSANRDGNVAGFRNIAVGFRVARTLAP